MPSHAAPDFSRTFVDNIHQYGRSFEVGLVAKHYLRHYPTRLPGMTTSGIGMVTKGRMGFRPHRIQGVEGLQGDPRPGQRARGPAAQHLRRDRRRGPLMAEYLYYPGCSMDGTAKAYRESLAAVLPGAGHPLRARSTTGTAAARPST